MDSNHNFVRGLLALALPAVLASCSLTPALRSAPELPDRIETTETTGAAGVSVDAALAGGARRDSLAVAALQKPAWWQMLGNEALSALMDSVAANNLDMAIAAERVLELHNQYRIQWAPRAPSVQFSGDGTRQVTPTNSGTSGSFSANIPGFPERFDITSYSASLGLGWEIDIWGKLRAASRAAREQYVAQLAGEQAVRLAVEAEALGAWAALMQVDRQRELTAEQVDLLVERTELASDRYERGITSSFELYQLQQARGDARAAAPLLGRARYESLSRLGLVMGGTAATAEALLGTGNEHGEEFAEDGADAELAAHDLLAAVPEALPSKIVLGRPDVLEARALMESARNAVGAARAEQFPSFSLTGTFGTQANDISSLVDIDQRFWLFGGSLTAPIFSSGARRAAARAAWNRYEQAALAYQKAILSAFRDVGLALETLSAERARYAASLEAFQSARALRQDQERRYLRGIGSYTAFVDARLGEVRSEIALSAAERDLFLARVGLYRAAGDHPSENP